MIERARSRKVASLAAGLLLTTFAIGVAGPVAFAPSASAATGTVSGTVYNDYNNNGVKDSGEPGVAGAVVYAYDVDGHQSSPATSDSSGVYTLSMTGVTAGAFRVELQTMPTGFQPSAVGTDNATTIRFVAVNAGQTVSNIQFAIQKPGDFCQTNPDIATTLFCVGNGSTTGATNLDAIWHSTYNSATKTGAAPASAVGSVLGVAWDPVAKRVFTSAYVKRHAGLKDTYGADGIYITNPATNSTLPWVELGNLSPAVDVGQSLIPLNSARDMSASNLLSRDPIFTEVGKAGIGDIETNGVDTLYVTNLYQGTVHAIPIPANGSAPTTQKDLGAPGATLTCTNGIARPFALAYKDDYIYSGVVCDASGVSATTANLDAYIMRTTGNGTWTQVGPRVDLDYNKGAVWSGTNGDSTDAFNKWHMWDDTFDASWLPSSGANSGGSHPAPWVMRPTPMLVDIAFDDDGSMILGFRDRTGDMIGSDNRPPLPANIQSGYSYDQSKLVYAMAAGDILRLCNVSGTYVLQGGAGCANKTANNEGPKSGDYANGGEYYFGDNNGNHKEVSIGHIAVAPRSGQLLLTAMNVLSSRPYNSAGVKGFNNSTGAAVDSISANYYENKRIDDTGTPTAVFSKANGMGDIEALCDAAPLEIGNRVWSDTNGNGIQDPAETGIDGVTVRLYAAADTTFTTPLGTAVTSAGGQYYFRTGYTDSVLTDNVGGGLAYRTAYVIRVGIAANYTGAGPLAGLALSPADQSPTTTPAYTGNSDTIDSDPASGGTKTAMGTDWFPTIAVAATTTLPGFNNHTYDTGFVPPKPYDLALRKRVVSMNGTPASGTVTFQLEVFNQTADAVDGVTITDYIDTSSFKQMTVLPSAGTTGGAAALGYVWSNASTTNPTVAISGVIPGNSSVTLNVTLAITPSVKMSGLVNTAEISKFDNDGNPANGDSTTGTVYDVDSIPDGVNTDVLVDDEIALKRWTNTATTQTQNSAVADEDDHDIANVPLYDLALIKTRSAGQSATVTSPATTASFDITVKNQGQTSVFNVTVLDSPVSPLTRSASTAASQSVTTTLGASVTVAFDSTTGVFTIPALAAGDTVKFTVIADLALVNTVQVNSAEITSFDNDNNAGNTKPSWVQDLDSTPDVVVGNDAIQPGTDPAGFPEDSHNLIDNAPINGANPADEDDQDTEAVQLGLLRLGSTVYKDLNGNQTGDVGEGVAGVLVQLFQKSGATYALVASTVTNLDGDYSFDRLYPGTYQIGIPSGQTGTGVVPAALTEWEPVAGSVAGPETLNFDNDGDAESGFVSRSDDVVLTFKGAPNDEAGDSTRANALTSPRTYLDSNSNLNIDFVFDQITYELGNLVWSDNGAANHYNNGKADSDEAGISGVTVELYRDNGAGGAMANDGTLAVSERIGTTTTSAGGYYDFKGLTAGTDYHVVVVKSSVPVGLAVAGTPVTVAAADGVDNDNNAAVVVAQGWSSGKIALGPVATAEPSGEKDGTTGTTAQPAAAVADNRADQTVDFGFVPSMRIGNQVWRDESDNNPVTQVSTDNNGVFNSTAGEVGLAGVSVELWRDVSVNGFQAAGDDVKVATTTTDSNGNYWFDGVRPGDTYFVAIRTIASGSATLSRPVSSTGQSASVAAADNDDDGAPDVASGYLSVSRAFTPTLGTASLNETDANQSGSGAAETAANARVGVNQYADKDSQLRVDFGFVNVPVYRIGNLVWKDNGGTPYVAANEGNGKADPTEPGIAGVQVQLFAAADAGFVTALATATTDSNGEYAFENLVAGGFVVRISSVDNATPLAGLISTVDGLSANADVDNDDNGVVSSGGWASSTVTLNAANNYQGGEPELESRRFGEAGTYDNGLSWTAITTDPATYANNRSNLTVDFGFTTAYRLGNLVWRDTNNDGIAQDGEPGIGGVLVQLLSGSTVVAETVTDGSGKYVFTDLATGEYTVRIPTSQTPTLGALPGVVTTALNGLASSDITDITANDNQDNDDNGQVNGAASWDSSPVTLGGASEPTDEQLRSNDPTDDDADAFADNQSNYSVDFGFWPLYRIGNLVWNDGNNDGLASSTPLESGINGVLVQLTDASGDTVLHETVTAGGGKYEFASLVAGTYRVQIPSDQTTADAALSALIVPAALEGFHPSTVGSGTPEDDLDNDSNGVPTGSVNRSGVITLGGTEPVTEQLRFDDTTDDDLGSAMPLIGDDHSDFTVDFGYYSISLGNQVFFDSNGNGVYEPGAGDVGIDGVTVNLRDTDGALVGSATTAGGGLYLFTGLVAGTGYYVEIPATEFATGGDLSGVFSSVGDAGATTDSKVDGLDRGVDPVSPYGAVRSAGVWIASASAAPSATDGNEPNPDNDATRPDSAENLVIDFGFYSMELGGTVFLDPTNNGLDGADGDFAGVTVLLLKGDGSAFLRADGSQATAVTDADGNYVFSGLPAGQYILEIPTKEFTEELAGYANSDGNDPVPSPDNDVTGEDNGYPLSGDIFSDGAVRSKVVTLNLVGEPQDDPSPTAGYADNMSNLSVDFGFWHAQVDLELGNQVWFDSNRDGLFNNGESPAPAGVVLQLLDAATGLVLDTTTTDSNGRYLFTGLPAGRYIVKLPPVNFILGGLLAGYMATDGAGVSGNPNDGTDSDSNALPLSVSGIKSASVTLRAAAPVREAQAASRGLDDRQSDLTVDFGLYLGTPLAFTGADVEVPLRQAGLLVGLGLILLFAARRRRED